ncbi:MAG: FHA domain-containing protein [Bradymonadaceae bacterium]
MSEGKASSKNAEEEGAAAAQSSEKLGAKLGGRFRAPTSGGIDMPAYMPEDDDAVDHVAKRFRMGSSFKNATMNDAPSLDAEDNAGDNLKSDELEGFLLDALESEAESGPLPRGEVESEPAESSDYELEELDTERVPSSAIESLPELPMVEVEPLSVAMESDPIPEELDCPSCGALNPAGMRFCVQCGGGLAPKAKKAAAPPKAAIMGVVPKPPAPATYDEPAAVEVHREPPPPSKAARQDNPWPIRLISINEDGTDGAFISLDFLETTVGRDGDQRFPTDAFLSPKHARFHVDKGEVSIEDLYSLNGTFIKLRDETRLNPGDTILMGRQVLRFERFEQSITAKTKSSDGTRFMGSPAPGGNFKILQVGIGGIVQNVYCLPETGAVLGREKGDIVFPHDKFMSGRHAQVYVGEDTHCYLVDLNSSNGTWIKIWEKTKLNHKDYIFMGQQLFRVHYDNKKR